MLLARKAMPMGPPEPMVKCHVCLTSYVHRATGQVCTLCKNLTCSDCINYCLNGCGVFCEACEYTCLKTDACKEASAIPWYKMCRGKHCHWCRCRTCGLAISEKLESVPLVKCAYSAYCNEASHPIDQMTACTKCKDLVCKLGSAEYCNKCGFLCVKCAVYRCFCMHCNTTWDALCGPSDASECPTCKCETLLNFHRYRAIVKVKLSDLNVNEDEDEAPVKKQRIAEGKTCVQKVMDGTLPGVLATPVDNSGTVEIFRCDKSVLTSDPCKSCGLATFVGFKCNHACGKLFSVSEIEEKKLIKLDACECGSPICDTCERQCRKCLRLTCSVCFTRDSKCITCNASESL